MKRKLILSLIGCLMMSTGLFATRTIVVERTVTGCFPACGSTSRTVTNVEYTYSNGRTESVDEVTIRCSGLGTNGCPQYAIMTGGPVTFDWSSADYMLSLCYDQVALGNLTGVLTQTFVNTSTSESFVFDVIWNVVLNPDGTQNSSFEVGKHY